MSQQDQKVILDVKVGNVTTPYAQDKVLLVGKYFSPEGGYVENVEIVINPEGSGESLTIQIPYTGYNLSLYLGDFNGDQKDDIMVGGDFGGSGGFVIAAVYTYQDGKLVEIFSPTQFSEKYQFFARYLDDYQLEVVAIPSQTKYIVDLSNHKSMFFNEIYNHEGKVITPTEPTVDYISGAYPIHYVGNKIVTLFLRQRIVGIANAQTLAIVESFVNLIGNDIEVIDQGIYMQGKENIVKKQKVQEDMIGEEPSSKTYILDEERIINDICTSPRVSGNVTRQLYKRISQLHVDENLLCEGLSWSYNQLLRKNFRTIHENEGNQEYQVLRLAHQAYNISKKCRNLIEKTDNIQDKEQLIRLLQVELKKCSHYSCLYRHLEAQRLLTRDELFYGNEFNIQKNNLDLIVNSIYDQDNTLYVDGYLLNLTEQPISQISHFVLEIRDHMGRVFAKKTFDWMDIGNGLRPYEAKRFILPFNSNEYSLFNADTSNISWNYTYTIQ